MANILTQAPELSASRNFTPFGAGEFDRQNVSRPMREPQRAGWTDEKGQRLVAMSERMRSAATMDDIRAETTKRAMEDEVTKNIMQDQNLIGPKAPKNEYDSALATVDMEARKDKAGNVMVYDLPSGDMGGSYEVAGINNKYHPAAAEMLKNLAPGERRDAAARYVVEYTKPFTSKLPEAYRPFFQDLAFNRGVGGATKFLQRAIGVKDDGALGPQTLKALEGLNPSEVMRNVSVEQMTYERKLAEQNPERKKFLNGLQNRVSNRYRLFGNAPTG
jgi:murein L,D-transpeptidase YcbB/YkuD